MIPAFCLDTSAILTLRDDEPGAERVASESLLLEASRIKASHSLSVADAWIAAAASGPVVLPKNGYGVMVRRMKPSNIGTVNAVMPWEGLHTIPLRIRPLRSGPVRSTFKPMTSAIAPERCRPGPSCAMA